MKEYFRQRKSKAFREGEEAVRRKPIHAPQCPYDADTQTYLYEAWEEGAMSAGLNDIYYNGELIPSERQ